MDLQLAGERDTSRRKFMEHIEDAENAVKEKKKNNYKIKIIEAKNFKQVLEELAK